MKKMEDDKRLALQEKLRMVFVTIERFAPIEKIVYGAVGLILVSFLTALIYLVIRK